MRYARWQVGMDIQVEEIRIVAVQRRRGTLRVCHWWHIPYRISEETPETPLFTTKACNALRKLHQQLPARHQLWVSYPSQRIQQLSLPISDRTLPETELRHYAEQAAAHHFTQPISEMYWDYHVTPTALIVTVTDRAGCDALLAQLHHIGLYPSGLTPCDRILAVLVAQGMPAGCVMGMHAESHYWLWAESVQPGQSGWVDRADTASFAALCSRLNTSPHHVALIPDMAAEIPSFAMHSLNVWGSVETDGLPLPVNRGRFALALGLAMGCTRRCYR